MPRRANALWASLLALGLATSTVPTTVQAEDAAGPTAGMDAAHAGLQSTSNAISVTNVPGPDGGVAWGRAEGILDARVSDVLAILHDYSQYAGLFPHFEQSRVLSQRGTEALVYLEANILHGATTLWGQVRMSSSTPSAGLQVVEAKMMKGKGNMKQFLARWEVRPLDDGRRTQLALQLLVDPDLPVPDMVVSGENKKSASKAFRALRKRLEQRSALVSGPQTSM